ARRTLDALERRALLDVGARAVQARLLVVPEREAHGAFRYDVGRGEDAGDLHDERGAGRVVVRGLASAPPIHVRAQDIHLAGHGAADLGRVDLRARLATVLVVQALGLVAPAPELLLDPVDGARVALGALLAVAELGQPLDQGLVALEVEPLDDARGHAVLGGHGHAAEDALHDALAQGLLARLPLPPGGRLREERLRARGQQRRRRTEPAECAQRRARGPRVSRHLGIPPIDLDGPNGLLVTTPARRSGGREPHPAVEARPASRGAVRCRSRRR